MTARDTTPIPEDRFTVKLHKLLEDAEMYGFQDIIGWNKDGLSFTIVKPQDFAQTVMRRYFRQSKYKSFQRQLNLYNFRRESKHGLLSSYSHPMFTRKDRQMCSYITRQSMSQKAKQQTHLDILMLPKTTMQLDSAVDSQDHPIDSTLPLNLNEELVALLQPVPMKKDGIRCYSQNRDSLDDDAESIGTIEGQILDEEFYDAKVKGRDAIAVFR